MVATSGGRARDNMETTMSEKQELVRYSQQQIDAASKSLQALAGLFGVENFNLIAPLTHMAMPKGMKLAITEVRIDTAVDKWGVGNDLVRIGGGDFLIRKHKLDQIAAAAGISWISERRLDGARHPHYCEMEVRGRLTDFDGTVREISGHKVIDLRESVEGVPGKDYDEIVSKARNAEQPRDPGKQLMEARKFIAEICSSKARNRAIASAFGIKRGYSIAELEKPFVIPKPVPDASDPEAREIMLANAAGATEALYGSRKKPEVIDCTFEEVESSQPAAQAENEPPHDPMTGEVKTEDEPTGDPIAIIKRAWTLAQDAKIPAADFRLACESNTGKQRKEDMTAEDAIAVLRAIEARIEVEKAGEDDGCPV